MSMEQDLTYELLEKEFSTYTKLMNERDQAPRAERRLWMTGLLAGAIGSLVGVFASGYIALGIVSIALLVEVVSFVVAGAFLAVRSAKSMKEPFAAFAIEVDQDYLKYRQLVEWLRQFTTSVRAKRLRYLSDRRDVMTYRLGLFTGGVERLGLLPLIGVLYLQFNNWEFGDWDALSSVNMLGGLLLWMLLLVYLGGWALIRHKSRLDAYVIVLRESLVE